MALMEHRLWLLKENADLFSWAGNRYPVNYFYQECHLPPSWKKADAVAIPTERSIQYINNHMRPISLTPILSKLREKFVVDLSLKSDVLEKVGQTQFGTVPNSCTTHALISMLHTWLKILMAMAQLSELCYLISTRRSI